MNGSSTCDSAVSGQIWKFDVMMCEATIMVRSFGLRCNVTQIADKDLKIRRAGNLPRYASKGFMCQSNDSGEFSCSLNRSKRTHMEPHFRADYLRVWKDGLLNNLEVGERDRCLTDCSWEALYSEEEAIG